MHRRSYYPDSVNRAITMNRAQLRKNNVALRDKLEAREIELERIRQREAAQQTKVGLFGRIKKFLTQPITFGRKG